MTDMNKQKRYMVSLLLCLLVAGSARVWVDQGPTKEYYEEGDTATLLCQIHFDLEKVEDCTFTWYIWNEKIHVENAERYQHRITLKSKETITLLNVRDLSVNDTDELMCITECFVDKEQDRYFGNGTKLVIHEKNEQPDKVLNADTETDQKPDNYWIGFLFIALNITVFLIVTVICVSIIKKMKNK